MERRKKFLRRGLLVVLSWILASFLFACSSGEGGEFEKQSFVTGILMEEPQSGQMEESQIQTEGTTEEESELGPKETGEKQIKSQSEETVEKDWGIPSEETAEKEPESQLEESKEAEAQPEEAGVYTDKEQVACYLHRYGHLPSNYISKKEAERLGWDSKKGNLDEVAPGKSIGGNKFGNREGLLPEKKERTYYECDIDYNGGYRGGKRIVYSSDGLIYYTEDHYNSFELLYTSEGKAE